MDANLLSILGSIIQAYSSLLGIVGMYLIFLKQRKGDQIRDLITRFKIKSDSLIEFINREISQAYKNEPAIRVNSEEPEEIIKAVDSFEADRKNEIPVLPTKEIRKLIVDWAIIHREKDSLIEIKTELAEHAKSPLMPKKSLFFFVGFFAFELALSLFSVLIIFLEVPLQYQFTGLSLVFAIIGIIPLGNLIYRVV